MKVTAREVQAAWLDDSRDTYHVDQKPVGQDRKQHEGIPTQEEFPNTWLPTRRCEPEAMAVEQIEVVKVELAAKSAATIPGTTAALPRVPQPLFDAWERVHEIEGDFDWKRTPESLYIFTDAMLRFIQEGNKIGLNADKAQMRKLERYAQDHPPQNKEKYTNWEVENHLIVLDSMLNKVHAEISRLTNTPQKSWYDLQSERLKDRPAEEFLTPEDRKWLQEKRKPQPYQGDPMLKELWERKRRQELTGRKAMKITAVDILPFDPSKRRLKREDIERKGPKRVEPPAGEMEQAFQEDLGPLSADMGGDVEALMYFYDNIAGSLGDVRVQMIRAIQTANPEQKQELARLIRNLEHAIQVLGS